MKGNKRTCCVASFMLKEDVFWQKWINEKNIQAVQNSSIACMFLRVCASIGHLFIAVETLFESFQMRLSVRLRSSLRDV